MLSIYTAFYNVNVMKFDWKATLQNWLEFLHPGDQISIAINTSTDDSSKAVRDWAAQWKNENPLSRVSIDIVDTEIPYENPLFDGLIKAAALEKCTQPFAILLDCDEVVVPDQYSKWAQLAQDLERKSSYDAFLIPVIDLIGDREHYKSVGSKFYLHKNLPHITRGVVRAADREDGSIDTSVSDSTELIYRESRQLVKSGAIMAPLPAFMMLSQLESGEIPMVYHLGWLNTEQRLRQSAFWRPVWDARRGGRDPEPEMTLEKLLAIPRFRHRLPYWSKQIPPVVTQKGDLWTRYN